MSLCKNIWPVTYKVVTYKLLRRFRSNILLKNLICFIFNIIDIIIFGRLALFRHTWCDLLCNFTITYLTLNRVIQLNSIHISSYSVRIPENTDQKKSNYRHFLRNQLFFGIEEPYCSRLSLLQKKARASLFESTKK